MNALVQEAIEQRVFPSAVCAVLMGGRIRYQGAWGYADPESQTVPDARTLYDLASLTKPVSTATLTLLALEEGKLTLEMPLTRFFGQAKHLQGITVYHLLTHTAGLPAYKPLYREAQGHDALIEAVVQTPLERLPGTGYTYSDLGYILLGAILEQVYGCSQAELFRTRIAEPLGMSSTGYNPPPDWQPRFAPTAHSESRAGQILRGEVHDENAWAMEGRCRARGAVRLAGGPDSVCPDDSAWWSPVAFLLCRASVSDSRRYRWDSSRWAGTLWHSSRIPTRCCHEATCSPHAVWGTPALPAC
jgi:serine-type D-Ala-D-Ala carboxypeptidase